MNKKIDSELILENKVIENLIQIGYKRSNIKEMDQIRDNIRESLSQLNNYNFSDEEFKRLYDKLDSGSVFQRAKKIRSFEQIELDDGTQKEIYFMHKDDWCKNKFEVANQINVKGAVNNRYDITILVNGIPMVQIELKKADVRTKEALGQITRYKNETIKNTIFDSIQLFIISNEDETKFIANNQIINKAFLFSWADEDNKVINNIFNFCDVFLQPCQIGKYIKHFMIMSEDSNSENTIIAMRSYQYYAVSKILEAVESKVKNGYVWHTTGSGKTLTSFKACEMISNRKDIDKVLFVVDRQDLDTQTVKEYQKFENSVENSIEQVNDTRQLKNALQDSNKKIIITTIQKLERAVSSEKQKITEGLSVVLVFDECHRSQLGDMHQKIDAAFNYPMKFGFTGTPILADNVRSKEGNLNTTEDVFGKALHKYLIHNAIEDKNVLGFYVDTKSVYKGKEEIDDKEVHDIDRKEAFNSPKYIKSVADDIINTYDKFTGQKEFNAMLATDGIDKAIKYFKYFTNQAVSQNGETVKLDSEPPLKVACVFSVQDNEAVKSEELKTNKQELESIINIYNQTFKQDGKPLNFSISEESAYKRDVAKRVKNREIDLLIVSDMFLTGFDAKKLNTLYFDKEQKYHNLIQAVSRTNRVDSINKTVGNIVLYRPNVADHLDESLRLFADKDALTNILKEPYENEIKLLNILLNELKYKYQSIDDVRQLKGDEDKLEYVKLMRDINSQYKKCTMYREFSYDQLEGMNKDDIKRYQTAYKDIYDTVRKQKIDNKETILDSIDFEIESIKRSKVNFDYITKLLTINLEEKNGQELELAKRKTLMQINDNPNLESKAKLLEKFLMKYYVQNVPLEDQIYSFNQEEKEKEIKQFVKQNNFDHQITLDAISKINQIGDLSTLKASQQINLIMDSSSDRIKLSEKKTKRNEIKAFIEEFIENDYI